MSRARGIAPTGFLFKSPNCEPQLHPCCPSTAAESSSSATESSSSGTESSSSPTESSSSPAAESSSVVHCAGWTCRQQHQQTSKQADPPTAPRLFAPSNCALHGVLLLQSRSSHPEEGSRPRGPDSPNADKRLPDWGAGCCSHCRVTQRPCACMHSRPVAEEQNQSSDPAR